MDATTSDKRGLDTIHLQIMWNRLISVVEEQAQTLMHTAFSPIVRECGDLSAGVFGLDGRMYAQAVTGTPGHVNSMAESVKHFLEHFTIEIMKEGDAYITNDPWRGTGHLNDFVITTPCFRNGKAVALFSCTSHLTDIGGLGTGTDATDVHMEGIYIPMLKLADRGVMNETLMAMIRQNTRQPVESEGDVYSLAACNDIGCQRLVEMMDEFALDDLEALGDYICATSEQAVRDIGRGPAKDRLAISKRFAIAVCDVHVSVLPPEFAGFLVETRCIRQILTLADRQLFWLYGHGALRRAGHGAGFGSLRAANRQASRWGASILRDRFFRDERDRCRIGARGGI